MSLRKIISLSLFSVFFLAGLFTLPHYGVNWDTINHLPRGQAYLHYFLTGYKNYSDLPKRPVEWQNPDSLAIDPNTNQPVRRSFYQSDATTYEWFMLHDGNGHPPASDILSAAFNRFLYGKLGIINDIDAYRVYGIFLSAILVALIFWWVSGEYNIYAGLISSFALMLYPLFWSEAHFNTEKDIPETAFWSFMLYCVWRGITRKNWLWILLSGVFFGLALGTKLNVVFIVFVIVPWLIFTCLSQVKGKKLGLRNFVKKYLLIFIASLVAPIIGLLIFILLWPYLWDDPITRIMGVVKFYKGIGLTKNINPAFLGPFSTNLYPLSWIAYTTPIVTLVLGVVGVISIFIVRNFKKHNFAALAVLWLLVPILRISLPGTNVYGGVRQIMEYIPALSIMAGIGSFYILKFLSVKRLTFPKVLLYVLIPIAYLLVLNTLIKIHPNENVYFNSLIGGLSGAKAKNIPSWGNTFGAAYRQGVSYIDKHAEPKANVVLVNELLPNIPTPFFRTDISFYNSKRSGYLRQGEWAITLTYQGTQDRSYYDTYLERFVKPKYQAVVDGVSVMKVWKNSDENLIKPWDEELVKNYVIEKTPTGLLFSFKESVPLIRIEVDYNDKNCKELKSGITRFSSDKLVWKEIPGVLPDYWRISSLGKQPRDGKFIEPFNGENIKYVEFQLNPPDTCLASYKKVRVFKFKN